VGQSVHIDAEHTSTKGKALHDGRATAHERIHDRGVGLREFPNNSANELRREASRVMVEVVRLAGRVTRELESLAEAPTLFFAKHAIDQISIYAILVNRKVGLPFFSPSVSG
jgi:hypothetical protein